MLPLSTVLRQSTACTVLQSRLCGSGTNPKTPHSSLKPLAPHDIRPAPLAVQVAGASGQVARCLAVSRSAAGSGGGILDLVQATATGLHSRRCSCLSQSASAVQHSARRGHASLREVTGRPPSAHTLLTTHPIEKHIRSCVRTTVNNKVHRLRFSALHTVPRAEENARTTAASIATRALDEFAHTPTPNLVSSDFHRHSGHAHVCVHAR